MTKWILIYWIIYNSSVTTGTVTFGNEVACRHAQKMMDNWTGRPNSSAFCVPEEAYEEKK